jgi:hypothetical protein
MMRKRMMRNSARRIVGALLLAGVAAVSQFAQAAFVDISHTSVALTLLDGTVNFGGKFGNFQANNTFTDTFSFTTTTDGSVESIVSSISSKPTNGLSITGFDLRNTSGVVSQGAQQSTGAVDVWSLLPVNLTAGSYFLRVSGFVVSDAGASFGGNVNVSPVPEPATYGMMLGGLALMGLLARRRNKAG